MSPSHNLLSPNTIHAIEDSHFTLGLKEILFLAFIFFIGFCGFTVCVDTIYSVPSNNHIESIVVHNKPVIADNPRDAYAEVLANE